MATRSSALRANTRLTVEALEARDVPASFHINNSDVSGLIAALKASNTDGQDDVIHLAKGGTYTLSLVADNSFGPTGLPGILADGSLIIQGNDATIRRDPAAPPFRVMLVNGGSLTLNRVTIANGSPGQADGGGINVQAGDLTVNNGAFMNNQTTKDGFGSGVGGAINLHFGVTSATITNCTFANNTANWGGAINSIGGPIVTVQHCTFTNNKAIGSAPVFMGLGEEGRGGAINNYGFNDHQAVTTVRDSTFSGNLATTGGGIAQARGQLTVERCTLTSNQATLLMNVFGITRDSFGGGAINTYFVNSSISDSTISGNTAGGGGGIVAYGTVYYGSPPASLTMTNCNVSGNRGLFTGGGVMAWATPLVIEDSTISGNVSARDGGGVLVYEGYFGFYEPADATIRNSTISGNTADRNGGGIAASGYSSYYAGTANAILHNCTVTANTAADGGGAAHDEFGTIALASTIVAGNHDSAAAATPDIFGDLTANFSLIGDGTGGVVTGANNLVGTSALPINAKLGPLANNGGHTLTHALLPGSPAINAGSNPDNLAFDQRGSGYSRVVGGAPDIGAYESQSLGKSPSGYSGGGTNLPLQTSYRPYFNFSADADADAVDHFRFRLRYGYILPPDGP